MSRAVQAWNRLWPVRVRPGYVSQQLAPRIPGAILLSGPRPPPHQTSHANSTLQGNCTLRMTVEISGRLNLDDVANGACRLDVASSPMASAIGCTR
jgi:hypothetical protein